jgi:hypothetical protein
MRTVYPVGQYKVVILSATYGVVGADGAILYRTQGIEDAIETAEDMQCEERAA